MTSKSKICFLFATTIQKIILLKVSDKIYLKEKIKIENHIFESQVIKKKSIAV